VSNALEGEVCFDASRRAYATDASIYQIIARRACCSRKQRGHPGPALSDRARAWRARSIARGGGYIAERAADRLRPRARRLAHHEGDPARSTLECRGRGGRAGAWCSSTSNARLKADWLFFLGRALTASRCTIGGMTGNNSCGARSIRYGKMVDNVLADPGAHGRCGADRASGRGAATRPASRARPARKTSPTAWSR
jgi:hypothetical protein